MKNWWQALRGRVKLNAPLSRHTTFKIGGPARFFIEPKDIADLKLLINLRKRDKLPLLVMGAGSNILAGDKGTHAAVLRLGFPSFKQLSFRKNILEAGSGASLNMLIRAAEKRGLSGLEFLAGIPGTLGGALAMNAGIPGKSIADLVESISVIDYNNRIQRLNKHKLRFGYRVSHLEKYIILSARLKLRKAKKKEISQKIKQHLGYRRATQDLTRPSAGCVFKNPQGDSTGRLIDLCGLKGRHRGGACISAKHANFIVNCGKARAKDVLRLMDLAKKEVRKKFGITLKPEIKIWD
jgi:UDP-N-acetylmuramate dehydrogenase